MLLLVLAIGLTLGALCAYAVHRVNAATNTATDAADKAAALEAEQTKLVDIVQRHERDLGQIAIVTHVRRSD